MRTLLVTTLLLASLLAGPIFGQATTREVKGHLRRIDGIDFVFVRGSSEDQAFAEGYLAGDKIIRILEDFVLSRKVLPAAMLWDYMMLPRIKSRADVPESVQKHCEACYAGIKARFPEQMKLERLNRDLKVEDLIAMTLVPDVMGLMCSSFAIWDEAVKGSGPIVGRNLDYQSTPALLENTFVIVRAPREDRAGWLSVGWGGFGCLTGISDRGVFISIHDVPAKRVRKERFTARVTALQELIETLTPAENTEARVKKVLGSYRYGMGGNVMIAWRGEQGESKGAVVAELLPAKKIADGVKLRGPEEKEPFVTCSNHHRLVEKPAKCWRYKALLEGARQSGKGSFDLDAGFKLIQSSKVRSTLYQVVVNLESGELALNLRRKPGAEAWDSARKLDLPALLLEAKTGPQPAPTPR